MSLKGKLEAIIYAAEEPVSLDQLAVLLKDSESPEDPKEYKSQLRAVLDEMISECASDDRGLEIRQVAGGYRISTKPEHHDLVRSFAKSLKPPIRLSLQALETLAVIAYKQPVTAPEISEIRGVDSSGVLATLIDRKLITTAGRKAVIGRPILYKTTKDFLMRFGLKDVNELPSMEEFEKMTMDGQDSLFDRTPVADATGIPDEAPAPPAPEEDENAHAAAAQAGSESGPSAPVADGESSESNNA
jgi:segregation and condensation protein B